MTAHAGEDDAAEILKAGIDECLTKPLKKDALVERIVKARPDTARDPLPGT